MTYSLIYKGCSRSDASTLIPEEPTIFSLTSQNTAITQGENHPIKVEKTAIEISPTPIRHYRRTDKPGKQTGPRTWRTRKDPFESVWSELRLQLTL